MPETKRKLAAILSADVVGYSRLMGADEEATVSALNDCRAIFKTRIAEHHGRVVDTAGDSVLAEFPSVVEAVRTAIEVQDALARRNEVLPEDRRMLFRIGVNVDDVIEQADGSIYGGGVNVAARLEALADPGGICVSASAFERVKGKLDQGFESMGTHDVKNIVEPVQVFRVTPSAGFRGAHVPTHKTSLKRTPARHTSPAVLGLAAAALVTVAAVAWWLPRSTQQPPPRYKLTELTKDAGLTTDPTLSPDGTFVAYASDRGGKGNLDIWTQLVSGGQPIQLTSDEANDYRPSYSGDGSQIAFRSDRMVAGSIWSPRRAATRDYWQKGAICPLSPPTVAGWRTASGVSVNRATSTSHPLREDHQGRSRSTFPGLAHLSGHLQEKNCCFSEPTRPSSMQLRKRPCGLLRLRAAKLSKRASLTCSILANSSIPARLLSVMRGVSTDAIWCLLHRLATV